MIYCDFHVKIIETLRGFMKFFTSDHHFFNYAINEYCDRPYKHVVLDNDILLNGKVMEITVNKCDLDLLARNMTVNLMNESFIKNWNSVVKVDDEVYYLGDFAFPCNLDMMKQLMQKLNGKKYLIRGNHDYKKNRMIDAGFTDVVDFMTLKLKNETEVVLHHYPYISAKISNYMMRTNVEFKIKQYSRKEDPVSDEKILKFLDIVKNYDREKYSNIFNRFENDLGLLKILLSMNLDQGKESHKELIQYRTRIFNVLIGTKKVNNGKILLHGHTHSKDKRFLNQINVGVDAWSYLPVSEDEILEQIDLYNKELQVLIDGNIETVTNNIKQFDVIKELNYLDEFKHIINYYKVAKQILNKQEKLIDYPIPHNDHMMNLAVKYNMMIAKDKLIIGGVYKGECRNSDFAYWTGSVFIYLRSKFGNEYLEEIVYPSDDEGFDVFIPWELLDKDDPNTVDLISEIKKHKKYI